MLKSIEKDAVFYSKIFKQEDEDLDWMSYKPTVKAKPPQINILPETTADTLETDSYIYEGMPAIFNDGTTLKEGEIVNVQAVGGGSDGTVSSMEYMVRGHLKKTVGVDSSFQHSNTASTGPEYQINDIQFSGDGRTMYLANTLVDVVEGDVIESYSLSTPFDTKTMILSSRKELLMTQWAYGPKSIVIDSDGGGFYLFSGNDSSGNKNRILRFTMTNGDITTAEFVGMSPDLKDLLGSTEFTGYSLIKDNSGGFYVSDIYRDAIFKFSESTEGDITTLSYTGTNLIFSSISSISVPITFQTDMEFGDSGNKLYVSSSWYFYQFDLSSPYDISTAAKSGEVSVRDEILEGGSVWCFTISTDGSRLFLANGVASALNRNDIYEFYFSDAGNFNASDVVIPANEFNALRIY